MIEIKDEWNNQISETGTGEGSVAGREPEEAAPETGRQEISTDFAASEGNQSETESPEVILEESETRKDIQTGDEFPEEQDPAADGRRDGKPADPSDEKADQAVSAFEKAAEDLSFLGDAGNEIKRASLNLSAAAEAILGKESRKAAKGKPAASAASHRKERKNGLSEQSENSEPYREKMTGKESVASAIPGDNEDETDRITANLIEQLEVIQNEKTGEKKKTSDEKKHGGIHFPRRKISEEAANDTEGEEYPSAHRKRKEIHFSDLGDGMRRFLRWKWGKYVTGLFVAALICVAITFGIRYWKYTGFSVLLSDDTENTASFTYHNVNGNILKCGIDSTILADRENKAIWSVSYVMSDPCVVSRDDTVAVYDHLGTEICICDENGQIGSVTANMPIIKVALSKEGYVAAILEEEDETWIQYYDTAGNLISTIKTALDSPGYPVDLALSPDGSLLQVSYIYMDGVTPCTRVCFYNFTTVGQNEMDNVVSSFEYRDNISPECEDMNGSAFLMITDDGFHIYNESQIPDETVDVEVDGTILSTFHNDDYIGFILEDNTRVESSQNSHHYRICVYNKSGRQVTNCQTDFSYDKVSIAGDRIFLTNAGNCSIYSLAGVNKFEGSVNMVARQLFPLDKKTMVCISEDALNILQLK